MLFLDASSHEGTRITRSGYLTADCKLARAGVYEYLGREVGREDLGIVRVLRPAGEVFSSKAMRSFANVPITVDHPSEPVSSSTWRRDAVGTVGEEIRRDGDFVRAMIRIQDESAIERIRSGVAELSCGYVSSLEWAPGEADGLRWDAVMRSISGNHVAIVAAGRAGSHCRIGA